MLTSSWENNLKIVLFIFCCVNNIYAQTGNTLPKDVVRGFYDGLKRLSNIKDYSSSEANEIECQINAFAEGGDDCVNKAQIDLPREFDILSEQQKADIDAMRLGPYIAHFENFIINHNACLLLLEPREISPVKGTSEIDTPSYYCYVVEKTYRWDNNKRAINLTDTIWVKGLTHRISGIRNYMGGSCMVRYSPYYSLESIKLSFYTLVDDKRYKEAYDMFNSLIADNRFTIQECKDLLLSTIKFLKKGMVKSIPSNVQKWLSLFYEAKYGNSKYMLVNKEYYKEDLQYLTKDTTLKYPFVHGLMPVYKIERPKRGSALAIGDKKYAFMSEHGKMATPYKFLFAEPFSKEYKVAIVGLDRVPLGRVEMIYGIINTDGEQLVKNAYISIRPFKNGLAAVRDIYYRWGFINTQGEEVVPCQYQNVTDYNCGWYGLDNGSKSTYVNLQGEYINSESYYRVWTFEKDCDLACVSRKIGLKEFIGCIDSRGREIIPTKYYSVKINGKEGTVTLQENRDSSKITKKISDYR